MMLAVDHEGALRCARRPTGQSAGIRKVWAVRAVSSRVHASVRVLPGVAIRFPVKGKL